MMQNMSKDKAVDFCRKQVLKGAIMESVKLLKSSSFDDISKVIEDAMKLGTDNNFGHDYHKDVLRRFEKIHRAPITTGWERIDDICKGGLERMNLALLSLQQVLVNLWFWCI